MSPPPQRGGDVFAFSLCPLWLHNWLQTHADPLREKNSVAHVLIRAQFLVFLRVSAVKALLSVSTFAPVAVNALFPITRDHVAITRALDDSVTPSQRLHG